MDRSLVGLAVAEGREGGESPAVLVVVVERLPQRDAGSAHRHAGPAQHGAPAGDAREAGQVLRGPDPPGHGVPARRADQRDRQESARLCSRKR